MPKKSDRMSTLEKEQLAEQLRELNSNWMTDDRVVFDHLRPKDRFGTITPDKGSASTQHRSTQHRACCGRRPTMPSPSSRRRATKLGRGPREDMKMSFDQDSLDYKEICSTKPKFDPNWVHYFQYMKSLNPHAADDPAAHTWANPSPLCVDYPENPYIKYNTDNNKYCCLDRENSPSLDDYKSYVDSILGGFDRILPETRKRHYAQHEKYLIRKQNEILLIYDEILARRRTRTRKKLEMELNRESGVVGLATKINFNDNESIIDNLLSSSSNIGRDAIMSDLKRFIDRESGVVGTGDKFRDKVLQLNKIVNDNIEILSYGHLLDDPYTLCDNDCVERTFCQTLTSCRTGKICEIGGRNRDCEKPTNSDEYIGLTQSYINNMTLLGVYLHSYLKNILMRNG